MAKVSFQLRGKKKPANITVRLSAGRGKIFRAKTGYSIDPEKWSFETNLPKQKDDQQKNLKSHLGKLSAEIEINLNEAAKNGLDIDSVWLQEQIDIFNNKVKTTDTDRLVNCIQNYINYLPRKKMKKNKRGATIGTIRKHKSLKVKIENFEAYRKKPIAVKDVGLKFIEELEEYFYEVDQLGPNTVGNYIKYLKTVCTWAANEKDIQAHPQLNRIKSYGNEGAKIFLSFDELETINNKTFKREALNNAKDWLIIGCYIGQRVSDLLNLTTDNITARAGLELIELTQKKTGKRVAIPMHDKIKEVLARNNGKFPYKISDQRFNEYIKDVCKEAGINELTKGGKMVKDEKTKITRKKFGTFPKHELITSHVCRRSYATNFYGEMPTSWLISITAHATENQFLEYVGKPAIDTAQQIAEFYAKQALQAKKEPVLTPLKKAE